MARAKLSKQWEGRLSKHALRMKGLKKNEREGGSARVVVVLVKLGAIARANRQLCAAEEYCHKSIVNGSAVHILVLAGDGSVRRSCMHAYLTALKSKHAFGKLRETCKTHELKV